MAEKKKLKNILELDGITNYQEVISIRTSYWYDSQKKYHQLLGACINLEELQFHRGAYIYKLPSTVYHLSKLHTLVLNDCALSAISPSIAKLEQLKKLIINRLYLSKFPIEISYLKQLEELDLYNTKIKQPIHQLADLQELRHLNLMSTGLKWVHFSEELLELPNLRELILPKALLKKVLEKHPNLSDRIPYFFENKAFERKHLLSLLGVLRRQAYSWHLRTVFLNLLGDHYDKLNNIASLEDIFAATDLPRLEVIRLKAFEYYEAHQGKKQAKSFGKNAHFAVVGNFKIKKKDLKEQLKEQGIKYSASITEKTTHLLLGQLSKKTYLEALAKGIPIITEKMVLDYINENTEQYLVDDLETASDFAENISDLLLSGQDQNISLAMQLFQQGGFSTDLLTELFIAYKETSDPLIRKEAAILLKQYGSVGLIDIVKKRSVLFPAYNAESALATRLRKLEKNTELDILKIAWHGYRKHNKGILFLLRRLPKEEKKAFLAQLIQNDVLNLSSKGLTSIPKEVYEFDTLQELNLKYNRIATINFERIQHLKNLKVLTLTGNYPLWSKQKDTYSGSGHQFKRYSDQQKDLKKRLQDLIPGLVVVIN